MTKIVNVLLDIPLYKAFSYSTLEDLAIGQRVLVEFHNRECIGFVLEYATNIIIDQAKIKPLKSIFAEVINPEIFDLVKFTSSYYMSTLGQTLYTAIPTLFRTKQIIEVPTRKVKTATTIKLSDKAIELTQEQQEVVTQIQAKYGEFHPSVLYGVTGSGKTEVYLELIAGIINRKEQVLVLVPEINLTPQLLARFKRRFENTIIHTLTSHATPLARIKGYRAAENGEASIIIGTRLSVFTPFKNLGLIIVDEEHDHSFKQNDGVRYNARDLAVFRAKYNNIPIILGSATPSLETLYNHEIGRYTLYQLTSRAILNATLPTFKLIDLNIKNDNQIVSNEVITAIEKRIAKKEISLVFINRRGFAPIISCHDCGFVIACRNCSTNMVLHRTSNSSYLKCHHCGFNEKIYSMCPECESPHLYALGSGSQKIEELLQNKFPNANVCRIDQDSMSSKHAWVLLHDKINNKEVDILVGTQMLAKGHDFHDITLVVGLNVDTGLYSYDFRANELLFAQLMQVAGRAGRGEIKGKVIIPTKYPRHHIFQYLEQNDYIEFAKLTLGERKNLGLPPYTHYAMLRGSGPNLAKAMNYIAEILAVAEVKAKSLKVIQYPVVPAIIQRLKNRERVQALIQCNSRENLHKYLQYLVKVLEAKSAPSGVTWNLDVDPLEM